ncbi:MAG: AsmA family protein [Deltaproteobacteria bacterium]|nr:AsmA family protein [Deltaproteobacteria bacterium]
MNRLLKTASIVIFLLLLVIAAAVAALWYVAPPDQVKDLITGELSSRLNRTITMRDFSMGFYPDVEFTAHDMRILDLPSSREIAAAKKIRFDLDTLQLLKRRFVVETVSVGSPRVNIVRNAAGAWNIADAVRNASAETAAPDQTQPPARLEFKKITIRNGSITINDEKLGRHITFDNLAGTINLSEKAVAIDSASLAMPWMTAELSGTIANLFTADPLPDISAKVQLRKEGPLEDIASGRLPSGSKIADVTLSVSGSTKAMALKTSFSIDPLATAGLPARGSATGTLQAETGLCTIDNLDLRWGKNTFAFSGSVNNLWQKERAARLEGTSSLSLDETVPLVESSALSNLGLKGTADARINLNASAGLTALNATIDLTKTAFTLPDLMSKESGSPASLLFDARFSAIDELIINNFELMLGENKITGAASMKPGSDPWMQTSLRTSPLSLPLFNQLRAVRCGGGVMTLSAQAWQKSRDQDELQYRALALMQDGTLTLKIMQEPFHKVNASIEAINNLVVIPQASFFLGEYPCQGKAEITIAGYPQITGQLYTAGLDIDALIRAFRKPEKHPQEPPPEPDAAPDFSLDIAVDTPFLCFGKLRTGAVSTLWHTSGRFQKFEPLYADLFGGTLDGAFHLSCQRSGTTWFSSFTGKNMDIEALCAQFFTGKTIATAKGLLRAQGWLRGSASSKKEEAWQSMQGDVRISAAEGEIRQSALFNSILLALRISQGIVPIPGIRDLNIVTILRDVAKSLTNTLDVRRMVFKQIDGSFKITDGIARTEDLYFVGDTADFAFKGNFDLVREEMDIIINVIPTGTIDSLVSKIPLVGKRIGKIKKATLSFNLAARGPFAKPDVQLRAVDKILP